MSIPDRTTHVCVCVGGRARLLNVTLTCHAVCVSENSGSDSRTLNVQRLPLAVVYRAAR